MLGLTDYITEQSWEDMLIAIYVLVADRLDRAIRTARFVRRRGPEPDYDDAQIITIALAADCWFDGDEEKTLHFLRQYHPTLWSSGIPDTSRFNMRRRELLWVIEWVLAPGSYPDLKVLPALCDGHVGLIYIGDKGYVSEEQEDLVWERGEHLLLPLRRDNQQEQWPAGIQKILGKLRHRVETAFSVMTTAFNLRLPHGRSFTGFVARTATKMLAYTISFFLAQQFALGVAR
jgi:hypothetical protein